MIFVHLFKNCEIRIAYTPNIQESVDYLMYNDKDSQAVERYYNYTSDIFPPPLNKSSADFDEYSWRFCNPHCNDDAIETMPYEEPISSDSYEYLSDESTYSREEPGAPAHLDDDTSDGDNNDKYLW